MCPPQTDTPILTPTSSATSPPSAMNKATSPTPSPTSTKTKPPDATFALQPYQKMTPQSPPTPTPSSPVVIEGPDSRDPSALHAIWPDNHALEGVRRTCQAAAHIRVSLCIHCQTRAFAIMETSDHATSATGANWPLLVANLRKQLTDPGWDKYDNKKPKTVCIALLPRNSPSSAPHNPNPRPHNPPLSPSYQTTY